MEMKQKELNEIIERHGKWIYGEEGGVLADISGVDLSGAYLFGVIIDKYMYQITGCGSFNTTTTYDVRNNQVICGCWVCNDGNTLENFEKKIEDIYGENGSNPNKKYYQEYMLAINFFKETKKL